MRFEQPLDLFRAADSPENPGEKFEVAIDGRDWEGDFDWEEELYLSEDDDGEGPENAEEFLDDDAVDSYVEVLCSCVSLCRGTHAHTFSRARALSLSHTLTHTHTRTHTRPSL